MIVDTESKATPFFGRSKAHESQIAYLVPEFPGQTHIFFWREIQQLKALKTEISLFSTRRPRQPCKHEFALGAQQATIYLFPPAIGSCFRSSRHPLKLLKGFCYIARLEEATLYQRLKLVGLLICATKLVRECARRKIRHIHIHSAADAAHIGAMCHAMDGIGYSITLHGPLADYGKDQAAKWRHAKFGLVITQRLKNELQSHLCAKHVAMPAIRVSPMGVDIDVFSRRHPYVPWPKNVPFRIFSCARINPCKGHAVLVAAVKQLHEQNIPVELRIAGTDELGGKGYFEELSRIILESGLKDVVTLLGSISQSQVKDELEKAHLFAMLSNAEPLGVAYMEAMAMGTPVLATNAGGVPELIAHGSDGILIDPQDPDAASEAIQMLMKTPEMATHLSEQSQLKIKLRFNSAESARAIVESLNDCAAT